MPSAKTKRLQTLRLEALEDRCLLSAKAPAQVTIQEMLNPSGLFPGTTILTITGTKKNDSISINDNGSGKPGNIFVSVGGGQDYMSTGSVSEILVATGKGNDHVTYELDGDLQPNVQELIFVSSDVKNGGGSVQFTANVVGKVLDGASLGILGIPDARKPTTMNVNDSGEIDGELAAILSPFPSFKLQGGGAETYNFSSTATIGPNATVTTGLKGSPKNDMASISYSGTNNGNLQVTEFGNGGNDQLSADVFMIPGSSGTVGSAGQLSSVQASGKKDHLQFTIHDGNVPSSVVDLNVFAFIKSKSKKDTIVKTSNVLSTTPGLVTIVP